MIAGHILIEVFGNFIVQGFNAGTACRLGVGLLSASSSSSASARSSCWSCAIQAYVFALLTSLYINDAVNLH